MPKSTVMGTRGDIIMLKLINELPTDFPIAGVHCVPVFDNGNLMMVWDREEKYLLPLVEDSKRMNPYKRV